MLAAVNKLQVEKESGPARFLADLRSRFLPILYAMWVAAPLLSERGMAAVLLLSIKRG
jgi:hypothetical protein